MRRHRCSLHASRRALAASLWTIARNTAQIGNATKVYLMGHALGQRRRVNQRSMVPAFVLPS